MIETLRLVMTSVFSRKVRAILTMLSVAIGVASVVLISAIGDYGICTVNSELESLGLNSMSITGENDLVLDESDLDFLSNRDYIESAIPFVTVTTFAVVNGQAQEAMIWGTNDFDNQIMSAKLLYGSKLTSADILGCTTNCVIDEMLAINLFGRSNAVGKSIELTMGGYADKCEIIGISKSDSSLLKSVMGEVVPEFIYLPYTTVQMYSASDGFEQIIVKSADDISNAEERIIRDLEQKSGIENCVEVSDLSAQKDILFNILGIITSVLYAVCGVTLAVSGLGIMTIMLVSVGERRREIGIKKAIGASSLKITQEFMLESLTISLSGSIMGILISVLLARFASGTFGVSLSMSAANCFYAVGCAVVVGIVFGIYPAYKAAKLKPIEALRYE